MEIVLVALKIFWRSWLDHRQHKKSAYAANLERMIYGHSFRYGTVEKNSLKYPLANLYRAYKLLLRPAIDIQTDTPNSSEKYRFGAFGMTDNNIKANALNLKSVINENVPFLVSPESCSIKGIGTKIALFFALTLLAIFILPLTLFSSHRASWGLFILQFAENVAVAEFCLRNKVNYFFIMPSFETDKNYTALLLQHFDIYVHTNTSFNPISVYYQQVVTNAFNCNVAFQLKESEILQKQGTWFVDKVNLWPPLHFKRLVPIFNQNSSQQRNKTLAFVSSGMWYRKMANHVKPQDSYWDSEDALIECLKSILSEIKTDLDFYVLLHPIEKKTEAEFELTKKHYEAIFAPHKVKFFPKEKTSHQCFDEIDITIAAGSSMNIERLFCGYKVLYAPLGIDNYFRVDDNIQQLCAYTPEKIAELVEKTLNMTTDEYFQYFGLEKYHHTYFQAFIDGKYRLSE